MFKPFLCLTRGTALLAGTLALVLPSLPAAAVDKVNFGTDWKAEAEHGGFYQAIATGIYTKHGIEVNLRPGGPQINQAQLLAAGQLDFNLASNSFIPLNFLKEGVPMVAVAALFQKDPQALLAHPGQGNDSLAALKGKPIMVGGDTRIGSWLFLTEQFEHTDALHAFGQEKMKEFGIVDSGDATSSGIGAMTERRWSDFFKQMSAQGVYPAEMDWKKAYTLQFVNKMVGMKH